MLIKNKYFWISTFLFLAINLAVIWLFYPRLISQYRSNKQALIDIDAQLSQKQQLAATINSLQRNRSELDSYFTTASRALPIVNSPELLLLDLDGLAKHLDLNQVKITVPFTQTASSSATTSSDDVKPGSAANSQPTVVSDGKAKAGTDFTISGEFGLDKTKQLITQLRAFIRWNKISSIDITSSDKTSATVVAQVFTGARPSQDFSGNSQLLEKAKTLLGDLQSFSNLPDSQKEGSFGRSDPFKAP